MDLTQAVWRKSSRSSDQGNCIEVAFVDWRKSSRSTNQANCVEVAFAASPNLAKFAVRDSKNAPGPALVFPVAAWTEFRSSGLAR